MQEKSTFSVENINLFSPNWEVYLHIMHFYLHISNYLVHFWLFYLHI